MTRTLFCFGFGYVARELAQRKRADGWRVVGTVRTEEKKAALEQDGFEAALFSGEAPSPDVRDALAVATHLLVSIPPGEDGDVSLRLHADDIGKAPNLEWIGYLSTTGVYGDHAGAWVDETAELRTRQARSQRRIIAERQWLEMGTRADVPTQIFRLAGIYGPGRSMLDQVRRGTARRIIKPGQVFSRIHVADIVTVLEAAIARPRQGGVYNVNDDEPAPPQDVVAFAADLLGIAPPPEIPFEDADLSPMGRSFYAEVKRTTNRRIKEELGVALAYPTYREGLRAIHKEMSGVT